MKNITKKYENEFWLQRYSYQQCKKLDTFCEIILSEIDYWRNENKKSKRKKREERLEQLKMLILNFILKPGMISYYRGTDSNKNNIQETLNRRSNYEVDFRWKPSLVTLVDDLFDIGFIAEKYQGGRFYFDNKTDNNFKKNIKRGDNVYVLNLSKFMVSPKRRQEIFNAGISPNIIDQFHLYTCEIRDKQQGDLSKDNNEEYNKVKHQLKLINEFTIQSDIKFNPPIEDFIKSKCMTYRDFNFIYNSQCYFRSFDGDLNSNGRYFGHYLQNIRKDFKRYIKINGEPCVDLDFKNNYFRLAASLNGIKLSESNDIDYYDLVNEDLLFFFPKKQCRHYIKGIITRIFSCKNYEMLLNNCTKAIEHDGLGLMEEVAKIFINLIFENYPWLKPELGKLKYKALMNIESNIGTQVILKCFANNIPVINMHDGFIIQKSKKDYVKRVMQFEWAFEVTSRSEILIYNEPVIASEDCAPGLYDKWINKGKNN